MSLCSPQLTSVLSPVAFVFGGCGSNVFALESILKENSSLGPFITFIQFIFVACQSLPSNITFTYDRKVTQKDGEVKLETHSSWIPRLKKRKVPITRWLVQVALYFTVSTLNNWAFGFHIPVALHIIFRSGGLAISMLTNYMFNNKRYTPIQIVSVFLVSIGIVLATFSAPPRSPRASSPSSLGKVDSPSAAGLSLSAAWQAFDPQYLQGIGILTLALFIGAFLGIWQEKTFKLHGRDCWQESLFYSHFLSLPLFAPLLPSLPATCRELNASPPLQLSLSPFVPTSAMAFLVDTFDKGEKGALTFWSPDQIFNILKYIGVDLLIELPLPRVWAWVGVNVLTQAVCVGGVNRLTSKVSNLTLSLILTVRKAFSLLLSVWWFQGFENLSWGMILGGSFVMVGTGLYSAA
ncbi:udp-n-acetylglucosamine transporter [Phaffia rhodozyma]|uniref:Udp-n-acetylglucosamine transporter n=1 Tax=Phaffia rhodozyma TaxID=264483 RepID=A0A0F7SMW0_PHARH|nr:udp-n-acetylglucosamine transporter [Phaffia rhodozyma]